MRYGLVFFATGLARVSSKILSARFHYVVEGLRGLMGLEEPFAARQQGDNNGDYDYRP